MPVETATESYYAFRELEDMSEGEAIQATFESFPTIPGTDGLRAVLAMKPPASSSCSLETPP